MRIHKNPILGGSRKIGKSGHNKREQAKITKTKSFTVRKKTYAQGKSKKCNAICGCATIHELVVYLFCTYDHFCKMHVFSGHTHFIYVYALQTMSYRADFVPLFYSRSRSHSILYLRSRSRSRSKDENENENNNKVRTRTRTRTKIIIIIGTRTRTRTKKNENENGNHFRSFSFLTMQCCGSCRVFYIYLAKL